MAYLANAIQQITRIPGRQRLRSSSTWALDVLSARLSTVDDRAFLDLMYLHGLWGCRPLERQTRVHMAAR